MRSLLAHLPNLYGKPVYTGLSPSDAIALVEKRDAERQEEIDRRLENGELDPDSEPMERRKVRENRLAAKNINMHLDSCGQLFKWLDPAGGDLKAFFFKTRLDLGDRRASEEREAFEREDVQRIPREPQWTMPEERDADYWVPLPGGPYGGSSRGGLPTWCQDIIEEDGIPAINIHAGPGRST